MYFPDAPTPFGTARFLAHSAAIEATVNLTIRPASGMYLDCLPTSGNTVSTGNFQLDRREFEKLILRSAIDFCDAALYNIVPRIEARDKLMPADGYYEVAGWHR